MIYSMTGFGRAELKTPGGFIRVEIKTINSKFTEINFKMPGYLSEFEDVLRKTVQEDLRRGKVSVFVSCPDSAVFTSKIMINQALAGEVFSAVKKLKKIMKISDASVSDAQIFREVLHYPEVLIKDTAVSKNSSFSKNLSIVTRMAMNHLKKARLQEGKALEKDFKNRLGEISLAVKNIEKRLKPIRQDYKKSLQNRMKEFIREDQLDKERLTIEVAQFSKNTDIAEEITRLKSHVQAVAKALTESGEIGRKIDFIGQEMTRETNTMGSKSTDSAIAASVIQIKSTIEKIREQAQNVE